MARWCFFFFYSRLVLSLRNFTGTPHCCSTSLRRNHHPLDYRQLWLKYKKRTSQIERFCAALSFGHHASVTSLYIYCRHPIGRIGRIMRRFVNGGGTLTPRSSLLVYLAPSKEHYPTPGTREAVSKQFLGMNTNSTGGRE